MYTYVTNIFEAFGITIDDLITVDADGTVHTDEDFIERMAAALQATGQDADAFREMAYREAEHAELVM